MSANDPSLFDKVDEAEEERALAEGEAAHAAGRVISHEAMMDWLASWGGPDELPPPAGANSKPCLASAAMKTTRYFDEQVVRKRPYVDVAMCVAVLAAPLRVIVQPDGRIRHWAEVTDARDGKSRIPRVVTLEDWATIHNAFFDRDFVRVKP